MPLGLGEMVLSVWLVSIIAIHLTRLRIDVNGPMVRLLSFWLALSTSLSLGAVMGMRTELFFDVASIIHDSVAYLLLTCLACMMAIELAHPDRLQRVAWYIVLIGSACMLLLLADGEGWIDIPQIEPWYFAGFKSARFRGWANDPNQLGLVAAFLTLTSLYLAEKARSWLELAAAIVLGGEAFFAGVLTASDTFTLCMLTAILLFVVLTSWNWLRSPGRQLTVRAALVAIVMFSTPLAVAAALPFVPIALDHAEAYANDVYDENDQGATRLKLWAEAYSKGLESWMLGFGPGAHLTSKSYKRAPPDKFEAHNTPMELFTQGGLIAVLAYLGIALSTCYSVVRARLPALSAFAFSLLVFSLFHYVIRHPIFWFGLVLCLLEAMTARRSAATVSRPAVSIYSEQSA